MSKALLPQRPHRSDRQIQCAGRNAVSGRDRQPVVHHLQAKLLSAIQSRSVVRVGSNLSVPTDIRLICATNRNLPKMVTQKQFREDLLYRINTIHIEIPSAARTKEDILPLAEMFLSRYAAKYHKQGLGIDTGAQKKLRDYPWPGNIRELQHTVEKAVIVCETENIAEDNLLMASPQVSAAQPAVSTPGADGTGHDRPGHPDKRRQHVRRRGSVGDYPPDAIQQD